MFTYVKGSSQADYELGNIISNPVNVYGLSESPTPPQPTDGVPEGKTYHYLYSDIRPLYGVPIFSGQPEPEPRDDIRKKEGFWWLEYVSVGNENSKGEALDYVKLKDENPTITYQETKTDKYKSYTAIKTFNYVDWELSDVITDLKQRTITARDDLVNGGYTYTMDSGEKLEFSTDVNGRQMLNNYYSQAINGAQIITIYMPDKIVSLTGDQMVELFTDMMDQTDGYYDECVIQNTKIEAATTIYDAQKAATWVYPNGVIDRT